MKEVDIARPVVEWLRSQHWEVYQEVAMRGGVIDIVATFDKLLWIIEVKKSLSASVAAQLMRNRHYAHYSSAAVPTAEREHGGRWYLKRCMENDGIGVLLVDRYGGVRQDIAPKLRRVRNFGRLRSALHEEQKTRVEAGTNAGGYWTPFKSTCDAIRRWVTKNPGSSLSQTMAAIDHHYRTASTARSCVRKYIERGVIKGVRMERDGRKILLYPDEAL